MNLKFLTNNVAHHERTRYAIDSVAIYEQHVVSTNGRAMLVIPHEAAANGVFSSSWPILVPLAMIRLAEAAYPHDAVVQVALVPAAATGGYVIRLMWDGSRNGKMTPRGHPCVTIEQDYRDGEFPSWKEHFPDSAVRSNSREMNAHGFDMSFGANYWIQILNIFSALDITQFCVQCAMGDDYRTKPVIFSSACGVQATLMPVKMDKKKQMT